MVDRVCVAIRIGGTLPIALAPAFLDAIESDGARADWEGLPVLHDDLGLDQTLYLVATEVAWGRFEAIEAFCTEHRLPFARWAGGSPGAFDAERVVFDGEDERTYPVTEDDELMVSASDIRVLGSYDAIIAKIVKAEFTVPVFRLTSEAG